MVLREVEKLLLSKCPEAPPGARFGGITFIHQFGSALNIHLHFHCCIIDGIFATQGEGIQFLRQQRSASRIFQGSKNVSENGCCVFLNDAGS